MCVACMRVICMIRIKVEKKEDSNLQHQVLVVIRSWERDNEDKPRWYPLREMILYQSLVTQIVLYPTLARVLLDSSRQQHQWSKRVFWTWKFCGVESVWVSSIYCGLYRVDGVVRMLLETQQGRMVTSCSTRLSILYLWCLVEFERVQRLHPIFNC